VSVYVCAMYVECMCMVSVCVLEKENYTTLNLRKYFGIQLIHTRTLRNAQKIF